VSCRFTWKITNWKVWRVTCEFVKALPPNNTHRAVGELWLHGERVRRVEFQANDLETAVKGLLKVLN
jgi:hypothetical protein